MYYTNTEIVKALADERLRRTSLRRMPSEDAAERAGPVTWLRHRAGHALIVAGEIVAHGGQTAARGVNIQRPGD